MLRDLECGSPHWRRRARGLSRGVKPCYKVLTTQAQLPTRQRKLLAQGLVGPKIVITDGDEDLFEVKHVAFRLWLLRRLASSEPAAASALRSQRVIS